jgi:hypothetical protein
MTVIKTWGVTRTATQQRAIAVRAATHLKQIIFSTIAAYQGRLTGRTMPPSDAGPP